MSREKIRQLFESAVPLHRDGDLDGAEAVYKAVLEEFPNHPDALHLLGVVANQRGDNHLAVGLIEHAADINPNNVDYFGNLALIWMELGRYRRSAEQSRKLLRLDPKNVGGLRNLAAALCKTAEYDDAVEACQTAIGIDPNAAESYSQLGITLGIMGDREGAIAAYRNALRLNPQWPTMQSNLIFVMQQDGAYDQAAIYAELCNYNRLFALPLKHLIKPHQVDSSPDRKLRIGWVSGDFRLHVVGRCLLPVFQAFDRSRFENFCYSQVEFPDPMTGSIRESVDEWQDIRGVEDGDVADLIRDDRIDVLIDLSLHSGDNRLTLFALKPAPVQACYLGYCGSTGLDAMDYRISHPDLDPPGADPSFYSEQTVLLARSYLCYRPQGPTPDVTPLPALRNGYVTFGCLNNPAKVSSEAIELWGRILNAVPGSRLFLYVAPCKRRQWMLDHFKPAGIGPERIEFVAGLPWELYVETYGQIDIGLDTFPFGAGITACDALWMGVPVVTLVGKNPLGRLCYSILRNAGHADLAATSAEQYVQIAADLAENLPKLSGIRAGLRSAMESSPTMDAAAVTSDLQDLLTRIARKG